MTDTQTSPFRAGYHFESGFNPTEPIYVSIPFTSKGRGFFVTHKATHTGGNCFVTSNTQSYDELNPTTCPAMLKVPVIRNDKATVDAVFRSLDLKDDKRPYITNPSPNTGYSATLREYLEAVEAAGVPVEYPEGWNWDDHKE